MIYGSVFIYIFNYGKSKKNYKIVVYKKIMLHNLPLIQKNAGIYSLLCYSMFNIYEKIVYFCIFYISKWFFPKSILNMNINIYDVETNILKTFIFKYANIKIFLYWINLLIFNIFWFDLIM